MFQYIVELEASKKHKGLVCGVLDHEHNRNIAYVVTNEELDKAPYQTDFIINTFDRLREHLEQVTRDEIALTGESDAKI